MLIPRVISAVARFAGLAAAALVAGGLAEPAGGAGLPPVSGWEPEAHGGHEQDWYVHPARDGTIYVANGSGVAIFDGQRWQFLPTPHRTRVRRIATDTDGTLVVSTVDDLLRLTADARGAPRFVSLLEKVAPEKRRVGDVLGLAVTPAGYYAASGNGLFFLARDGSMTAWPGRFQQLLRWGERVVAHERETGLHVIEDARPLALEPLPGGERTRGLVIGFLLPTADGALLAWTRAHGLEAWRDGRWTPRPTAADAWMRETIVVSASHLRDGSLLVGTQAGLVRIAEDGRELARFGEKEGLPSSIATHIALDAAGDAWLAMHDGVGRIGFSSAVEMLDRRHGVPAVNAVARHRGRLLVAADTQLLALAGSGAAASLAPAGLGVGTWSFAHVDGGRELFVAALDGIQRLSNPEAPPAAFRFEPVIKARFAYSIFADRSGAARLFALTDRGLHVIEREGPRWVARDVPALAFSGEMRWLAQEDSGALWIGSANGKVARAVPADAGWRDVRVTTFDAASGLPAGAARVSAFRGGVIVGTVHGPFVLEGDRFVPDARLKDLPQDRSGDLEWLEFTEMAGGEIWARIGPYAGRARPHGVGYAWDPAALAPAANEPVYDFYRDADGSTWVSRSRSLLRLAPDARPAAPAQLPRLRAIRDGGGEILAMGAALAAPALAPGLSRLRLEFAWPEHANAAGARFRSRLEGHEADYSPWTPEAHRDLGGLWGGHYVLHIETMDRYGRVARATPYSFDLPPPWYRTWWAWSAWALAFAGGVTLVAWQLARWRTRRLLRAQARLERTVEERTAQVRNQAERLKALDVAKSGFFAGVTHEFRTPLTLILEPLRELREGVWGKLPARASGRLDHIERNARRVLGLVNQLLDLQSAEAGTIRLGMCQGDLAALVRVIAGEFRSVAEGSGLALEIDASGPVTCWFDPGHMESVVANLVSNAVKYTPAGGHVRVRVGTEGEDARLVVENSGPGIPAEALPRLFERFYRAPPGPGESARGAGIGLAVVKEIVERHGGRVSAASGPGEGARFEVVLPLGDEHIADEDRATPTQGEPLPGAATSGALAAIPIAATPLEAAGNPSDATTVLVVDDNVELREFLAQRLTLDFRVLQAGDGEAGLALARESLPDVIVTDVNMPRMDGVEMLRRVKADPATATIPVIMLASRATVQARAEGFATGADDYIYKPFNTTELLARIAGLIASRSQLREALVRSVRREEQAAAAAEDPLIARVRTAVLEHLGDSGYGVAELASDLHMERTTLFKRLKAIGAPAPARLMRDIRLDAAARMLREAAGQVTEVAYACGYQSLSHFSSSFSEKFGMSPSEYLQHARSRVPD